MTLRPAAAAVWVTTAPEGPAPMTRTSTVGSSVLLIFDVTVDPQSSRPRGSSMVLQRNASGSGEDAAVDDERGARDGRRMIRQQERHRVGDLQGQDRPPDRLEVGQSGIELLASTQC